MKRNGSEGVKEMLGLRMDGARNEIMENWMESERIRGNHGGRD